MLGKSILTFYRCNELQGECRDVPFVLLIIIEYFESRIKHLKAKNIFNKLDDKEMMILDRLDLHIAFGDYPVIFSVEDPRIITYYLKSILKYMEEPLCTFVLYSKFKIICEALDADPRQENKLVENIKEVLEEMD